MPQVSSRKQPFEVASLPNVTRVASWKLGKKTDKEANQAMLPTELWCHVFSFMTGKDVAPAVALVCKEWSAIVSEQTLWRALYLSEWELSKRDHIDINLHREFSFRNPSLHFANALKIGLSWRQLYQRKRSEERFWWKSLFEEDYEQLSEIFVYTSNKENSLAPREFDVAKIQQDSQNRVDDQLIFVIDDQQGTKGLVNPF